MDFKRYFGKIKGENEKPKQKPETVDETQDNIVQEQESEITKQVDVNVKKTLNFVDDKKDPHEYIRRYLRNQNTKIGSIVIIQITQYMTQLVCLYLIM